MDEKDWIIARLLYALYAEGRNADNPDAIRSSNWFRETHSTSELLNAYTEISKEGRKVYSPYWRRNRWSD
jgi:hypothetical protein